MRLIAIALMSAGCATGDASGETLDALAKATADGRYVEARECHFDGCWIGSNRDILVDKQLTRAARNAARRGDCTTVVSIDLQLRKLDANFHDTVFIRDSALAPCLATHVGQ